MTTGSSFINKGAGLGLGITAVLLTLVHLVLFSREHCACCGAPPAGSALPITHNNMLKAHHVQQVQQVQVQQQQQSSAPVLPPNWVRCGPEAGTGDYWYGAWRTGLSPGIRAILFPC